MIPLTPDNARFRTVALLRLVQSKHHPVFVVSLVIRCVRMSLRDCSEASSRVNRVTGIMTSRHDLPRLSKQRVSLLIVAK